MEGTECLSLDMFNKISDILSNNLAENRKTRFFFKCPTPLYPFFTVIEISAGARATFLSSRHRDVRHLLNRCATAPLRRFFS